MSSQPGLKPATSARLDEILARRPRQLNYGGGGTVCRLVCGYLACDKRLAGMLLTGLPTVVRVNVRGSNAGKWLESSVRYALAEARSPRPGGEGVLAKLAEVLFIEVLRLYMHQQGEGRTGWLAGVGDRIVGAALNALHRKPCHTWTLEELARTAGTSRSVLAERFQQMVGVSPMQYLTQWRMLLAANLLRSSNSSLLRIAEEVGYQTDTAFSRAFRREYGAPPAAWRRGQTSPVMRSGLPRRRESALMGHLHFLKGFKHGTAPGLAGRSSATQRHLRRVDSSTVSLRVRRAIPPPTGNGSLPRDNSTATGNA